MAVERDNICVFLMLGILLSAGNTAEVPRQTLTKELYEYLFDNYDPNLLPECSNGGNAVRVVMDLALRQIMELNEPLQLLKTNVWMRLKWNDCRLTWNKTSFQNFEDISVKFSDIWFPDITLYDSAAEEVMFPGREFFDVYVTNSGQVAYNFPTVLTSICRVNAKYFPFDIQTCSLKFGSWTHHGLHLDLLSKNPAGDKDTYYGNNEWILEDFPVHRDVVYYNCCEEPYPSITYEIIIRRRPSFYVVTMLFPCIIIIIVAAYTFILPTESGEKITLEITALLSLAVFLLVVSEALPPASDNFPIIGTFFAASMVLVSLSLLQTVVVVNLFHRGSTYGRVPNWVKTVCFRFIARLVFHKSFSGTKTSGDKQMKPGNDELDHLKNLPAKQNKDFPRRLDVVTLENNNRCLRQSAGNGEKAFTRTEKTRQVLPRLKATSYRKMTLDALEEQNEHLKSIEEYVRDKSTDDMIDAEWRHVANVLDRLFLVFYIVVSLITTLSFLLPRAS